MKLLIALSVDMPSPEAPRQTDVVESSQQIAHLGRLLISPNTTSHILAEKLQGTHRRVRRRVRSRSPAIRSLGRFDRGGLISSSKKRGKVEM